MTKEELIIITKDRISKKGHGFCTPYKEESKFQTRLIYTLKDLYGDDIWFFKASDRYSSGIPDILGCIHGKFFAFELKDDKGKATTLQRMVMERIKNAGGKVWVVRTVEETLKNMITILETLEY